MDIHNTERIVLAFLCLMLPVRLGAQDPPAAGSAPASGGAPRASATAEGFRIEAGSDFTLQLRGLVQFDGRFFSGAETALGLSTFTLRRVRPIVSGSLGRYFAFNVTPDFGGGISVLQDAWLELTPSRALRVRVGKFRSPVGLERLQSASALLFVERAFPTALVPNRDVGVMVHGEAWGGVLAYAAGVFDGAPDGGSVDGDLNDSKDLAGRVFLSPFRKGKSALQGLGFGIAGTTGRQSGPLPAYRSSGQVSLVTVVSGVVADGTRNRYSPQLSFFSGRFGLLAEYAHSESWVLTPEGVRVRLLGSAWETSATLSLTGDTASYAGTRPRRPFDPAKGQWGAVDLAARVHGLELGRSAFEGGAVDPGKSVRRVVAWAVGLNWSLTRNVKQVVDFERATFGSATRGAGSRSPENVVFIRTQLSF
jgi:phosphate-selective porin OprO/OprP